MKLKLLLLLILFVGVLSAQEPYRQLMITQIYTQSPERNFAQITNMGDKAVNLKEFKFGNLSLSHPAIMDVNVDPFTPQNVLNAFMMPDYVLQPGESYVITNAFDFGPRAYAQHPPALGAKERPKNPEWYEIANILIHQPEENGDETDSITTRPPEYLDYIAMNTWDGRNCYFLEHHFAEGDSAAIDQFGGVFDNSGQNFTNTAYDVAGVELATANCIFVRKYKYKTGNLNFANARGLGYDDSEWIVIPRQPDTWRDLWWLHGTLGDYVLDANTLESDIVEVDFENKKLTVPWGVRRLDGIMRFMKRKPGIAWFYHLNDAYEDSLYRSVRTGDKLEILVCGNELTTATFDIVVSPPTNDANIVVPKDYANLRLPGSTDLTPVTTRTQSGILSWPRVTAHAQGTDTIWGVNHGLPYALRTDSLLKRLEKPANANWEFVWVDDIARPDIKNGDKLKVTAQNGDVKEYYLLVKPYEPSHNALLNAITWPDVPEYLKGIFGWKGDTIPGFNSTNFNYRIEVPLEVDGIPALVAKAQTLNAEIDVKRATSLTAGPEARTISFIVTAEDDSVQNVYNIELVKEKDPVNVQPFYGEPFLSEIVHASEWYNDFKEIYNPGNQPLDLSNYLFAHQYGTTPSSHITSNSGVESFANRYRKYVPGYKWVNETQWQVTPSVLEPDLSINPILQPGEVFTMGFVRSTSTTNPNHPTYIYPPFLAMKKQGINFSTLPDDAVLDRHGLQNPWGEIIADRGQAMYNNPYSYSFMIFEILNDSVKQGLKPADDPNDFRLIEAIGNPVGGWWTIGGERINSRESWRRKPEVYKPNPVVGASFGTTWDDSEWVKWNQNDWLRWGFPYGHFQLGVVEDVGKHYMIEPTHYKSTVSSVVYKVSDGYFYNEQIRGVKTNTAVSNFLSSIIKADEDQTLTVKATADGSVLTGETLLSNSDTLVVLSADSINTTKYILEVTEEGLSDDAVLTSILYQISVEEQPVVGEETVVAGTGIISGFEYGTRLRTILNNIAVPMGATMDVINSKGEYVPAKRLNYDTAYVDVTVNAGIYFDVLAEDGLTRIIYQLNPTSTESDAFVLSDIYTVIQSTNLIQFIPRGTNVRTFLSNIVPAKGATVKLVDKMGHERIDGGIAQDDKVVVTSADGQVTRAYYLSMLRTEYILDSNYLAYILSNAYAVDQVNFKVTGPTGSTLVSEFNSNITPAIGATAIVTDVTGNEKTSGDLNQGDMVKVTSADGIMVVIYEIEFVTAANKFAEGKVQVYPNPTSGKVNIQGLEQGTRIQVFNQIGALLRDIRTNRNMETISLDSQPSGLYLIVLVKDNQLVGQYKIIRR